MDADRAKMCKFTPKPPVTLCDKIVVHLPRAEAEMIYAVGKAYALTDEEILLLAAIRRVENGAHGLEFGVGADDAEHPARREKGNPDIWASFQLQAEWAAGTVKRRYNGDLWEFAKRYCPPNAANWQRMVQNWITKMEQA